MKKLAFSTLEIERMPGLPGSIRLDGLADGIVIIAGPNASGKTTSARAMNYLLWPEMVDRDALNGHFKPHEISIHGTLKLGDETWISGYNFGSRIIQRENQTVDRLPLSPPEHRSRYNLWLARLLADTDHEFAEHILRESLGGYNLEEAAEKLIQKTSRPSRNLSEYRDFQQAEKEVRELTEEHRGLKRQEEQLLELRKEKEILDEKVRLIRFYEELISHRETEEELLSVEEKLREFHQAHRNYHRQIFDNINSTDQDIVDLTSEIRELDQDIEQLEENIRELGLSEQGIPEEKIEKMKSLETGILEADRLIEKNKNEINETENSLARVRERIKGDIDPAAFSGFDTEIVSQAAQIVESETRAVNQKDALEKELNLLGEESKQEHDSETIGKGIDLLKEWVREVAGMMKSGITPVKTGLMLLLALAAVVGMYFDPYIGLIILIPIAWWVYEWSRSDHRRVKYEEKSVRRRFGQTGLEPPEEWEMDSVKMLLLNFVENYKDLRFQDERRGRRKTLRLQLANIQNELAGIEKKKNDLLEKSGFKPGGILLPDFYYLIQHIADFNTHSDRLSVLQKECERLTGSRKQQTDQFNAVIQEFVEERVDSAADIKNVSGRLDHLNRKWKELHTDLNSKKEQRQKGHKKLQNKQGRLDDLYEQLGLEAGNRAALLKIDENHDRFLELSEKRGNLQHKKQELKRELENHSGFEEEFLAMDKEEARRQKEFCESAREKTEETGKRITAIETQIQERKKHRDLERALKRRDICRERLDTMFEQYLQDYFLSRIIDTLKQENQKRNFPAVFDRASSLLFRFTENRYSLTVESDGQFAAVDHANREQIYALDELSEGTRIQLLLAVRLAFVEHSEEEIRLPFFADELLAVSDDIRAKAIMDALTGICREGRQVFYFTARGDEVEKWLAYAKEEGIEDLVQLKTIGRGEILQKSLQRNGTDMLTIGYGRDIPAPDNRSYEEYGELLNVPVLDLMTQEVERIHPWYLTNDTHLIYECLRHGLLTWGQIQAFLKKGRLLEGITSKEIAKMTEAAALIKEVLKLWRVGRPGQIDRSVLRRTDAISGTFIEKADKVAESVDFDPVRFMEAVENGALKRFQNNKKEELREFLEQEGYLPSEQAYSEEELNTRIKALINNLDHLELDESWWILENILGIE